MMGDPHSKWVTRPCPRPLWGTFVIPRLTLDIAEQCAKFDDFSFSRFRDMIGAHTI